MHAARAPVAATLVVGLLMWGTLDAAAPALQVATAPPPKADVLVSQALDRAKAEKKTVFVEFGASWCGPCRELERFIGNRDTHPYIDANFIVLPITVFERGEMTRLNNPGSDSLIRKLGGANAIPFFALLDESGKKLASGPGVPVGRAGIEHFIGMLADAAPRLTPEGRDALYDTMARSSRHFVMGGADAVAPVTISEDGRYLAYAHSKERTLHLRDLRGSSDQPLTASAEIEPNAAADRPFITGAAFSGEGPRIAYGWRSPDSDVGWADHLRVTSVVNGTPTTRTLARGPALRPFGWSTDGRAIFIVIHREAGDAIATVPDDGGTLTEIASFRGTAGRAAVSPNGRFVAIEVEGDGHTGNDIVVLPVSLGSPVIAVRRTANAGLIGWSRDSSRVIYAARLSGIVVAGVAMKSGKPGDVKATGFDFRDSTSVGVSSSDVLYYLANHTRTQGGVVSEVWMADGLLSVPSSSRRPGTRAKSFTLRVSSDASSRTAAVAISRSIAAIDRPFRFTLASSRPYIIGNRSSG